MIATFAIALLAAPNAETVRLQLKTGDTYTYKTTSEMDSEFMSGTTTDVTRYEVVSAQDGWYRIRVTTVSREQNMDGPAQMMQGGGEGLVVSYEVNPLRQMRNWKLEDAGDVDTDVAESMEGDSKSLLSMGFQSLVLPEGELEVGTTWKHEQAPPTLRFGGGDSTADGMVDVEYKVLEFTGEGADRTVVIEAKATGDIAMDMSTAQGDFSMDMSVSEDRKFWVNVSTGMLTRMESDSERAISSDFGEFVTYNKIVTVPADK